MDLPLGGGRRSQINQAADGLQPCNLATLPPPSPTPAKEKPPLRLCRLLDWSLGPTPQKPPAQTRLFRGARKAPGTENIQYMESGRSGNAWLLLLRTRLTKSMFLEPWQVPLAIALYRRTVPATLD
jgi:hypothetical protein